MQIHVCAHKNYWKMAAEKLETFALDNREDHSKVAMIEDALHFSVQLQAVLTLFLDPDYDDPEDGRERDNVYRPDDELTIILTGNEAILLRAAGVKPLDSILCNSPEE